MKKFLLALLATTLATPALAAQQPVAQLSSVTASREALRTAINTQLSAVQSNFDEVYAVIDAGPVYVNTTAPADTKVVWIDTDQDNAIKVYVGGVWTVVGSGGEGSYTLPTWMPSAAPTADNQIIQATGGCSNIAYTDQSTCEANSGTWTPPVGAWTSVIDGLINDAGTGTDDLLSASEIDTRISSAGAFYQLADGDLDTAAGASAAGNSKLFGTNASGVAGWYDIPVDTDTDDQTASEVGFTPNGSIAATTVQAAVQEVRDEAEMRTPSTLNLPTDTSITAQQLLDNRYISNQGATGEVDITLPAVSYSISRTVLITEAQIAEINPPSGEAFDLGGTALDADDCIDSPATVGAKAVFTRMQNDTGAWFWSVDTVRGSWVDTGASD